MIVPIRVPDFRRNLGLTMPFKEAVTGPGLGFSSDRPSVGEE